MEKVFPYPNEAERLARYARNAKLLEGSHFEVLALGTTKRALDARMKYIMVNFNSLVANVSADMLFGEEVQLKADKNQEFIENLYHRNKLKTQFFESAVSNAALGDSVFKVRVVDNEIVVDDTNPAIYFPVLDVLNARQHPKKEVFAWTEMQDDGAGKVATFLVVETHEAPKVTTQVFELTGDHKAGTWTIGQEIGVDAYNATYSKAYAAEINTGISHNMIVHTPNYRPRGNAHYFGTSDFLNLESLQRALNNRMTMIDQILDKHSDPILAVPEGVLDEQGQVRKEALGMIEMSSDGGGKPEYIVWNANLDSAFKQIDKIVEFMFLTSETNTDVFGMGSGQAETGRALKMRLLRTIAKRNRKRLYYDQSIKEVCEISQELSKANGYTCGGIRVTDVERIQTVWSDGIVDDAVESVDMVVKQVESGIMSKKTAVQTLQGTTEEQAEDELEDIDGDQATFDGTFPTPPAGQ